MIIAGVLLPCSYQCGIWIYGITNFSPIVCLLAVQNVGFYADALVEGVKVAILGGTCPLEVDKGMYIYHYSEQMYCRLLVICRSALYV